MSRRIVNYLYWGKLFLPLRNIRYFPPSFTLRDPIAQGVEKALKRGHEVAVIVYKLKNVQDYISRFGYRDFEQLIRVVQNIFEEVMKQELTKDELILLNYHSRDGFTLFLKVDEKGEKAGIHEVHAVMNKLLTLIQQKLQVMVDDVSFKIDTGFMFIEKNYYSLHEAIDKAHHLALMMAEKQRRSDYNEMVYELSGIIADKNIRLLAQPIIDIKTKKIQAWEMLTRGPEGSNLEMPLRLFSAAQQAGHLYDLEMIVIEKTFEKIVETKCAQEIFVNCTPLTLGNKRYVLDMKKLLLKYPNINPKKIVIEMTEQETLEDKRHLIQNIRDLRDIGFRIALDDTGAGYSSLHSISEILPEIIKIDRAVIQNIHENSVNESMLMGILLIAKEVGSRVVAEGIEKQEEAKVLARHKVDFVQGYYFARPAVFNQHLLSAL